VKQRLLDVLTIFSLLLCCDVVILWVRSYWQLDVWVHDVDEHSYAFRTDRAAVCYRHLTPPPRIRPRWSHEVYPADFRMFPPVSQRSILGFQYDAGTITMPPMKQGLQPRMDYTAIVVPDWALVLCFGFLPARRAAAFFKKRRRVLEGHCKTCGYDLRATPDRCPECGTIQARTTQAQVQRG
jgi:hypothetical protein